ncbi:MAG TPA: YceI family protein [Candidatus Limnocylindrales bacterium]|nr:YceI family protein [Candidatus Limnocylindrales bacterium]
MTRSRTVSLALIVVAAIAVGGYLLYDQVLRGDAVATLTLPSTSPSTSPSAEAAEGAPSLAPAASVAGSPSVPSSDASVAGEWTVGAGSVAGYRVREQLANLPAESDAVGRTEAVTGSITVEGDGDPARLVAGSLTVDTTTIQSDESRRDNRLRNEGLQTDQFPTATFTVTKPVEVPTAALSGTPSDVTLIGDLTLHGVTKSVEIPAQAQLADGRIQVAGSITFPLSDFDITPPNVGGFILSISDQGALEFLISFEKR